MMRRIRGEGNSYMISSPDTFVTYSHPQKMAKLNFSRDLLFYPKKEGLRHITTTDFCVITW